METNNLPWAIMAAILTGIVVISIKIYDYYHNKSLNDMKIHLDVLKALKDNGYDEKSLITIKKIVYMDLIKFNENHDFKEFTQNNHPSLHKTMENIKEYLVLIFAICVFLWFTILIFTVLGIDAPTDQMMEFSILGIILLSIFLTVGTIIRTHLAKKYNDYKIN